MSRPEGEHVGDGSVRTIELEGTAATQQAVHEAIGLVYDEFALDCVNREGDVPDEVFDRLEELYVATAEDAVSRFELSYELECDADDRT